MSGYNYVQLPTETQRRVPYPAGAPGGAAYGYDAASAVPVTVQPARMYRELVATPIQQQPYNAQYTPLQPLQPQRSVDAATAQFSASLLNAHRADFQQPAAAPVAQPVPITGYNPALYPAQQYQVNTRVPAQVAVPAANPFAYQPLQEAGAAGQPLYPVLNNGAVPPASAVPVQPAATQPTADPMNKLNSGWVYLNFAVLTTVCVLLYLADYPLRTTGMVLPFVFLPVWLGLYLRGRRINNAVNATSPVYELGAKVSVNSMFRGWCVGFWLIGLLAVLIHCGLGAGAGMLFYHVRGMPKYWYVLAIVVPLVQAICEEPLKFWYLRSRFARRDAPAHTKAHTVYAHSFNMGLSAMYSIIAAVYLSVNMVYRAVWTDYSEYNEDYQILDFLMIALAVMLANVIITRIHTATGYIMHLKVAQQQLLPQNNTRWYHILAVPVLSRLVLQEVVLVITFFSYRLPYYILPLLFMIAFIGLFIVPVDMYIKRQEARMPAGYIARCGTFAELCCRRRAVARNAAAAAAPAPVAVQLTPANAV